jgi:NADH:ubiquinone oxidoreductase subunit 5 (subunit L)/multisubunit Na+/H+ antiporter MnhA subunit
VIHAVDGEQDMRYMGGLRTTYPVTFWMMTIGTLALTGVGIPGRSRLCRLLLQGRDHRVAFASHNRQHPALPSRCWSLPRCSRASIPGASPS